jgi:hypothetical protein
MAAVYKKSQQLFFVQASLRNSSFLVLFIVTLAAAVV